MGGQIDDCQLAVDETKEMGEKNSWWDFEENRKGEEREEKCGKVMKWEQKLGKEKRKEEGTREE